MAYGEIYKTTWWGLPVQFGWGGIYFDLAFPSAVPNLLTTLQACLNKMVLIPVN